MRAVVMEEARSPLHVGDVADPDAPADGVVIRVMASGLCRSDWHAWSGHFDTPTPHVLGHEFAGVVAQVGSAVKNWTVGQRVTAPFIEACGQCEWCATGNGQVCPTQEQPGFSHWGSFAELVVVHAAETNLIAIPDGVSFHAAASLGCRFATAYRALTSRAMVRSGEWVTVIGAGGVGLSTVTIAKALGAHVVAVDRNASTLEAAASLGADATVLSTDPEVAERIFDATRGGSHVAVDAVGSEEAASRAILSLRRRGRHVQIGLLPPVSGHPRIPMDRVIGWELDLLGSHGMAASDYPGLLRLIESGALRPEQLVGDVVGLAEAAAILPRLGQDRRAGMTVLDPTLT